VAILDYIIRPISEPPMKRVLPLRFAVLACAMSIASLGCRDISAVPQRLSALYVLQTINGLRLPATAAQGDGQQYVVLADSLRFDVNGMVTRSYTQRWISSTPPLIDTIYSSTLVLPYSIDGKAITIGYRQGCGPLANCIGYEEGFIDASTVQISGLLLWSGAPEFVFKRR
jgi:hypothetical protein